MKRFRSPIFINWKIKEETLQEKTNGSLLTSKKRTFIHGVKYYAQLYPNGRLEEDRGKVHLNLQVIFGKGHTDPLIATFSYGIPSAHYFMTFTTLYEKSQGGNIVCFTRDDLFKKENLYISDGYLNLQIRGSIQRFKLHSKIDIFKPTDLGEILWNSDDKDFTIMVDGEAIMAHKCILAQRSKYFAAMFKSGMKESKDNKTSFSGFPYSTVEAVVKACYDRDITDYLIGDNIDLILSFMDLHEFGGLKALLESYLIKIISLSNVVSLANASHKSNSHDLKDECLEFITYCLKNSFTIDECENLNAEIQAEIWQKCFSNGADNA